MVALPLFRQPLPSALVTAPVKMDGGILTLARALVATSSVVVGGGRN